MTSNSPIEEEWNKFCNPSDTHDKKHLNYNMPFLSVLLSYNWVTSLSSPYTTKHIPQKQHKEYSISNLYLKVKKTCMLSCSTFIHCILHIATDQFLSNSFQLLYFQLSWQNNLTSTNKITMFVWISSVILKSIEFTFWLWIYVVIIISKSYKGAPFS